MSFLSVAAPRFATAAAAVVVGRVAATGDSSPATGDSSLVRWVQRYEISLAPGPRTDDALRFASYPRTIWRRCRELEVPGDSERWSALSSLVETITWPTSLRDAISDIMDVCAGGIPPRWLRPLLFVELNYMISEMLVRRPQPCPFGEYPLDCSLVDRERRGKMNGHYYFFWPSFVEEGDWDEDFRVRPTFRNLAKYLVLWTLQTGRMARS